MVSIDPRFDQAMLFRVFAQRLLPGDDIKDFAANTGTYHSSPPAPIYNSHLVNEYPQRVPKVRHSIVTAASPELGDSSTQKAPS
eukprot:3326621-Pleurochrysis_carterae.AAC.5